MAKQEREIERRFVTGAQSKLEIRVADDGQMPELQGYASVFNQWTTIDDWWGGGWQESVAPGAFTKTIGEADIRALLNHDPNVVLGRNRAGTLRLNEDATGLRDVIQPPANEWGRPVVDAVKRGDISGQSIAFQVIKEKWERPEKKGDLSRRTILEAKLFDVSVVTYPAFSQTSVSARSLNGLAGGNDGNLDVIARAMRLMHLAPHGYPLTDDDQMVLRQMAEMLKPWIGDNATVGKAEPDTNAHSAAAEQPANVTQSAPSEGHPLSYYRERIQAARNSVRCNNGPGERAHPPR